jgi:rhamnosyl/mannosyltransferase
MLAPSTRILHFGRFDSDAYGGLEYHVRLLLGGLKDHIQVHNLVAADHLGGPAIEQRAGYRVFRTPSFGLVAGTAISPMLLVRALALQRQYRYDAIHLHFPDPLSHAAALLFPRDTRLIVSWHSDIVRQERLLAFYRPFLRLLLRRADAIVAATPTHFSSSSQLPAEPLGRRLFVVPYGIDYSAFALTDRSVAGATALRASVSGRPIIFALGRHVYYKGFEYLIRAMGSIDGVLLLGGHGPLTADLQRLVRNLGLESRVRFLGRVPSEDLPNLYHAAEVFCLPSVERSEQFGLVQLEAMACRKPVVCCELGNGVSYVNQHGVTGLVVPPRDPSALASAIQELLKDADLRRRMGDAGHERATREFSIDRMVSLMLSVYERVLDSRNPS